MSDPLLDSPVKSEPGTDSGIPPPSDYDALMTRLRETPHDPESWKRLVHMAETSGDTARIRQAYEALLEQYPNNPSAVIPHIAHVASSATNNKQLETLFTQYLRPSPSVAVWKCYLDYIKKTNAGAPNMRDTYRKAYDYVLKQVGQDRDSGSVWADYLQVLKSEETTNTWETQQKMDALRKVYQRAVQIPLDNVESLWSDYESFEMGLNKITAKKFMSDLSPAYMQARSVLRQLSTHLSGLGLTPNADTAKMWLPALPTFSPQERPLIGRWKAYLKWEEGNPLEIEEKDRGSLILRVQMAYRKAMLRMRYYPEIWFMAYSWNAAGGRHDEAINILKAGLDATPDSFSLTYAYAEILEKAELKKDQRDFTEVHTVYDRFIGVLRANLVRLSAAASEATTAEATTDANGAENSSASTTSNPGQDELDDHKKRFTNAWINYMRFARRAEGHKAYRDVFSKARREEYLGWEAFEAAALTEYRCNTDIGEHSGPKVAGRIFENGMKKFGTDVSYVLSHLGFLLTINDENNARALFERVIGTFTPQQARPIWERWSRSQYQYDDLEAVLELERRMSEVYPNDAPIKRFAQRHTYHSIDAIADHDLGFARARKLGGSSSLTRTDTPTFATSNTNGNNNGNNNATGPGNGVAASSSLPTIPNSNKRPPPPPDRKRENDYKRPRPDERDRERRRHSPPPPPSWADRERDMKPQPPPRREPPREKEEKPPTLPPVLDWFMRRLPPAAAFDGPVFNTENLMDKLRTAVIPSSNARRSPPPSHPPRSAGRPPPDYGPYQGPGGATPRGGRGRY
ncbi:Suf-domain-containing protein [Mycena belliarum]|uniref:mRNA 3'-end-processing protein RNA14 n=1 Tax=Mycena belliarum TaxID=1033014 RepID=A0AAD6XNA6_9AGAR|nr:Suf-domain-containing protein [Mycena belliae]